MLRLSFVFSCAGIFWGFRDTYCPLLVNAQNNKGVNQGVEPRGDVTDVKSFAFIPQLMLEDNRFAGWCHFEV